ncbi:MAG TPA: ATP-binding protein [Vicinamibacteria bacterium]|nr:ATP-binding protein [Vicinamibacteria bacterium]
MMCPKCNGQNSPEGQRCGHCGSSLSVALLEVERGHLPERLYFLKPRAYTVGRARHNDLCLSESSISKVHARILYEDGGFAIEDQGSLHGVYVDAKPIRHRAELRAGSRLQLGNITLKFSILDGERGTDPRAENPWLVQQKLLLSLVQALNSTLVVSEVLDQVLDAVMRITRAERAFLLLTDGLEDAPVAGDLRLRLARGPAGPLPLEGVQGISRSVVRRALETGRMVATGNAAADPSLASSQSVAAMELRTIVCTPLRSPRAAGEALLGAIYVDNQESSAPFSPETLEAVDALGRHAALAIENAQLFEREERRVEELRQAQQQLLQSGKLATIGQMAAGIAHELNTPLTYIMGNVELLLVQPLTETQRDMLASVGRGAERIKTLVQRLLLFSRPAQEEPAAHDVNALVERSLEFCHYQILKAGVHLEKRLAPDLPPVRGIASQLESALINLVVNAVQAMGEGGRLTVTTSVMPDVQISVTDTGPGIPEDAQPKVFEPFFTTKTESGGTGLGLSTVLMAVERHHGRVEFETRPGNGTTFRITLPRSE